MNTKKYAFIVIALLIAALIIIVISKHKALNTRTDTLIRVTVSTLSIKNLPETIRAYGTTVSPQSTSIAAETSGTISSIHFNPGDAVKTGQLLFTLKSNDAGNQASELKAAMQLSQDTYYRQYRLNKNYPGAIAAATLKQLQLHYQHDLAAYNESLTTAQVLAPIDGIISDTNVTAGSLISEGTVLADIINPESLQVKYALPSEYAQKAAVGQSIRFYPNDSSQSFSGMVTYVSPLLDPTNFTLTIRANLTNTRLPPNVFGTVVQIINPIHTALVIPQQWVQTDSEGFYVYVVDHGKVAKHYFTPGDITRAGVIEVLHGLTKNTPIITSDYNTFSPGESVRIQ